MKIFIAAIAIFTGISVHAQIDMDSTTITQIETKPDIINKARNVLFEFFEAGNKAKVADLQRHLNDTYENSNYIALYPDESLLLYYWTGEYHSVFPLVERIDSLTADVAGQFYMEFLYKKISRNVCGFWI
jgi:hypothetical protein